jgi:uncharacterized membrane protein
MAGAGLREDHAMIPSPAASGAEELVVNAVLWLKLGIEAMGALVILAGAALAARRLLRAGFRPGPEEFTAVRLTLARFLALALEFQLGADILSTAVAPGWEAIGKLGAIAVIRTALNWFLSKELQESGRGAPLP